MDREWVFRVGFHQIAPYQRAKNIIDGDLRALGILPEKLFTFDDDSKSVISHQAYWYLSSILWKHGSGEIFRGPTEEFLFRKHSDYTVFKNDEGFAKQLAEDKKYLSAFGIRESNSTSLPRIINPAKWLLQSSHDVCYGESHRDELAKLIIINGMREIKRSGKAPLLENMPAQFNPELAAYTLGRCKTLAPEIGLYLQQQDDNYKFTLENGWVGIVTEARKRKVLMQGVETSFSLDSASWLGKKIAAEDNKLARDNRLVMMNAGAMREAQRIGTGTIFFCGGAHIRNIKYEDGVEYPGMANLFSCRELHVRSRRPGERPAGIEEFGGHKNLVLRFSSEKFRGHQLG